MTHTKDTPPPREGVEADSGRCEIEIRRGAMLSLSREDEAVRWAFSQANLATALLAVGEVDEDVAMLREAVDGFGFALAEIHPEEWPRQCAVIRMSLGDALFTLGHVTGETGSIAAAIAPYSEAAAWFFEAGPAPEWVRTQFALGNVLRIVGDRTLAPVLLRDAVHTYTLLLELLPRQAAPAEWLTAQRHLAMALRLIGEQTGDPGALRDSVSAYELGLDGLPRDEFPEEWASTTGDLGSSLAILAEKTCDATMAAAAVSRHRDAAAAFARLRLPVELAMADADTGSALLVLSALTHHSGPATEAAHAFRSALLGLRRHRGTVAWALTKMNLGSALRVAGEMGADGSMVTEAIACCRAAVRALPSRRHPVLRARARHNLGNALRISSELDGSDARLHEAEACYRSALKVLVRNRLPQEWAVAQMNLGTVLLRRAETGGGVASARLAVAAYSIALEEWPRLSFAGQWAMGQMNLGTALTLLGGLTFDQDVMLRGVEAQRLALGASSRGASPDWSRTQMNLGHALRALGALLGEPALIVEAVAAYRVALADLPNQVGRAERGSILLNLGIGLLTLGEMTADRGSIHEATGFYRLALGERSAERQPIGWARIQVNLANALIRAAEFSEDASLAQDAVDAARGAASQWPKQSLPVDWANCQIALGTALMTLGQLTGDAEALEEAVAAYRDVVDDMRDTLPREERATARMNLGGALLALGTLTNDLGSMADAAATYRLARSIRSREKEPRDWAIASSNASNAVNALAVRTQDAALAREAVAAASAALEGLTPDRRPSDWAAAAANRGRALAVFASITEDPSDWSVAAATESALLTTLGDLVWTSASVGEQLSWSSRAAGSAARLVECLLRLGRHAEAMDAFQRGTALQLSIGLRLSSEAADDASLSRAARQDWRKACVVAEKVDQELAAASGTTDIREVLGRQASARSCVAARFSELRDAVALAEVRPPEPVAVGQIEAALPEGGALVVLMPTEAGTAIFAISKSSPARMSYSLVEGFAAADLSALVGSARPGAPSTPAIPDTWLGAYQRLRQAVGADGTVDGDDVIRWNAVIERCLGSIWERLMGPLDAFLRTTLGLPFEAELTMVAGGMLSLLPLHAARRPLGHSWKYFLEDWTVSYAPSPAAWIASRRRSQEPRRQGNRLLAVTTVAGINPALGAAWLGPSREIASPDADNQSVLEGVRDANYVSLYCHGIWNPAEPGQSALLMGAVPTTEAGALAVAEVRQDDKVTVQDFREADLGKCRLAMLWACESAMIGIRQSSEALGFPTALIDAGVPAVIASLWMVEMGSTHRLAAALIAAHVGNGLPPAAALRQAQLAMIAGIRDPRDLPSSSVRSAATTVLAVPARPEVMGGFGSGQVGQRVGSGLPPPSAPFYWAAFTLTGA